MLNHRERTDALFQLLADPVRRAMIERLAEGPASVSELARALPVSLPGVMQHLAQLEAAGLVKTAKTGRVRTCTLQPMALAPASDWLDVQRGHWQQQFDALGRHIRDKPPKP